MTTGRLFAVLLAALACLLAVMASPAGALSRPASRIPASSGPHCGGPAMFKDDGTPWVCTFDDEFSGSSLDPTKWLTWDGTNYFNEPDVCYYSGPDNVSVSQGHLNLSVTRLDTPQQCKTPYGVRQVNYGAGLVYTQGLFSQTYGMFSARIKFAGGTGMHNAFWMWPNANNYPGHAEIDVAETWGALPNTVYGSTHITGLDNAYISNTNPCTVTNWAKGYHTYTVQWSDTALTFIYDGTVCQTVTNWKPLLGFAPSAPFNQPFYLILQSLVDNGTYSPAPDASTEFPATTKVDWVRAWK